VRHARRNVVAVHNSPAPYFIVTDDIDKDGTIHQYEWRLHTLSSNTVDLASNPIRISSGGGHLNIYPVGHRLSDLSASQQPFDNGTEEPDATVVSLEISAANPQFAFILCPLDGTVADPTVTRDRFDWGTATVLEWEGGSSDCLVFNPAGRFVELDIHAYGKLPRPHQTIHNQSGRSALRTDATLALLRFEDGELSQYIAAGVSRMIWDQIPYIDIAATKISCALSGTIIDIDRELTDFAFYGPQVTMLRYRNQSIEFEHDGEFVLPSNTPTPGGHPPDTQFQASAHPNPFNPTTYLSIELARSAPVRVDVFDVGGRLVKTVHDGPLAGGRHLLEWDGTRSRGGRAASGTYFARVSVADRVRTVKLLLLK
jgi:hypothetical protein